MRLKKLLGKTTALLLSGLMLFNQCGLDTFANSLRSNDVNEQTEYSRDIIANPQITIQHYLNFPQQEFANIKTQYNAQSGHNYDSYSDRENLSKVLFGKLVVWNTSVRDGQLPHNNIVTSSTSDMSEEEKKAAYSKMRELDPKYELLLDQSKNDNGEFINKYTPKIKNVLYKMFVDEEVNYLSRPQIRYMNKLYNAESENAYNPNYTLKEIWLKKDSNNKNSIDETDFVRIDVPQKIVDGQKRHDPSAILFTNDSSNIQLKSGEIQENNQKILWAKNEGKIIIHVTQDMVIRLVFDPTEGQSDVQTVDFFDYDISDGWIYTTQNAAKTALDLFVNPNSKGGKTLSELVPELTSEEKSALQSSKQYPRNDQGAILDRRIPTSLQSKISPLETQYIITWHQGVNEKAGTTNTSSNFYAFGNDNARTGLGSVPWSSTQSGSDLKYNVTPNMTYRYNRFGQNWNGSSFSYPDGPNLQGASYNLIDALDDQGNPIWNIGDEEKGTVPEIFSLSPSSNSGITVYPGASNLSNSSATDGKESGNFVLGFNRLGGTYTLDSVSKVDGDSISGYSALEKGNSVYSNRFWPMDLATSYGSDGHDIKFGSSDSDINEKRVAVGRKSNGEYDQVNNNNVTWTTEALPTTDFGGDHNSYFGMKVRIPFVLENGYAAPLRYFFYGDDDLIVFISQTNEDGNIIDGTTKTKKIADIGGVHSSQGMFVNVWDFIDEKEVIDDSDLENISDYQGQKIYYYNNPNLAGYIDPKANSNGADGQAEEDEKPKSQNYVMTVFYTERGASGSSCYMRFSLPFSEMVMDDIVQNGELQVTKEIKKAENSVESEDQRYVFRLDLTNPDDTPFMNAFPISFTQEDDKPSEFKHVDLIGNGYLFTLSNKETAHVTGLPTLGPGDTEDTKNGFRYKVTEIGIYDLNKENPNYKKPENFNDLTDVEKQQENIKKHLFPLKDVDEMTTFQYGKINAENEEDGEYSKAESGIEFGHIISGFNKVKFINAENPAVLNITKKVVEDKNTSSQTETGSFVFNVKLTDSSNAPILEVPYFIDGAEEFDEKGVKTLKSEEGVFNLTLQKDQTYTLYNLPKGVNFEIQETLNDQYVIEKIDYSGESVGTVDKNSGVVQGVINGPKGTTPAANITYTNKSTPNTKVELPVQKFLEGRAVRETDQFKFKISADSSSSDEIKVNTEKKIAELEKDEVTISAQKNEKGEIIFDEDCMFGPLTFTPDDANNTFTFIIEEEKPDNPIENVEYSTDKYKVETEVTFENNVVSAPVKWYKNGNLITTQKEQAAKFTNTFTPQAVLPIPFEKQIYGTSVAGDTFTFTLSAGDGAPADTPLPRVIEKKLIATGTKDEILRDKFGPIKFTKEGTYKYKISETTITQKAEAISNIQKVKDFVKFSIQVTSDENDGLTANIVSEPNSSSLTLINTYKKAEVTIPVTKNLIGRQIAEGDRFEFELYEVKDGQVADSALQSISLSGLTESQNTLAGSFDPIPYTEAGTYSYQIREKEGNLPNMEYDSTPVDVIVTVSEDKTTKVLSATTQYRKGTLDNQPGAVFENRYLEPVKWKPEGITKRAIGTTSNGYQFEMNITAANEKDMQSVKNPGPIRAESNENGEVQFESFVFTGEGQFTVTVKEISNSNDSRIQYDNHQVTYGLQVKHDPVTGELSVTAPESGQAPSPNGSTVFVNDAGIMIVKDLVAGTGFGSEITEKDQQKAFEFKATFTNKSGQIVDGSYDLRVIDRNHADQINTNQAEVIQIQSGEIFSINTNQVAAIYKLPYGTHYVIEEVGEVGEESDRFVLIKTENAKGDASEDAPTVLFTNLKVGTVKDHIQAYKSLSGLDDYIDHDQALENLSQFKFELSVPKEAEVWRPIANDSTTPSLESDQNDIDNAFQQEGIDENSNPYARPGSSFDDNLNNNRTDSVDLNEDQDSDSSRSETLAISQVPLPEHTQVSASSNGEVVFGDIEFTQAGTYYYQITEVVEPSNSSYKYDRQSVQVVVKVIEVKDENENVTGLEVGSIHYVYPNSEGTETETEIPYTFKNEYVGRPDLKLDKTQSHNSNLPATKGLITADAQDTVTYYITASVPDTATAPARGVKITDYVPYIATEGDTNAQIRLVEGSYGDGVLDNGMITWDVGTISPGQAVTRSFVVQIPNVKEYTKWQNAANASYKNYPNDDIEEGKRTTEPVEVETRPLLTDVSIIKKQAISVGQEFTTFSDEANSPEKAPMLLAGNRVRYELTVQNTGQTIAKDVAVTDQVPETIKTDGTKYQLKFIEALNNGVYDENTRTIRWELGDLAPNTPIQLYFDVEIPTVSNEVVWDNTGILTYTDPNTDEKKETPSNPVFVKSDAPDLKIEKTQSLDGEVFSGSEPVLTANAYDTVTYNLKVQNTGKVDALGVVIRDVIPTTPQEPVDSKDALSYIAGSAVLVKEDGSTVPAGINMDGTVTWNIGTINPNEIVNVQFKVQVPKVGNYTKWQNVGTVSYTNNPDKPDKEIPSKPVEVEINTPNVRISKLQAKNSSLFEDGKTTPLPVETDDVITYWILAENIGTAKAEGVVIQDTYPVPTGLILIEDSLKADGGKLSEDKKTITWDAFDLDVKESKYVSFQVRVPKVTEYTKWTNIASLTYVNNPENPTDPSLPKKEIPSNPVDAEANAPRLKIEKEQAKNDSNVFQKESLPVNSGDLVIYKLIVTNTGTATAEDITITDTVPEGLLYQSASDEGVFNEANETITWTVDSLQSGESVEQTFVVQVPETEGTRIWTNIGYTSFGNNPDNPDDPGEPDKQIPSNEVEIYTPTPDAPHVVIRKKQKLNDGMPTTLPLIGNAGDKVTYYLTVTNTGSEPATNLEVTDDIPSGLDFVEDSISDQGTLNGRKVSWTLNSLAPGKSKTFSFQAVLPKVTQNTTWKNVGIVTYENNPDGSDEETPSNEVVIETELPEVTIEKQQSLNGSAFTKDPFSVKDGDIVTYKLIVKNVGKLTADKVVITDKIPEGLTYVDKSISDNGKFVSGVLTWEIGDLKVGESQEVTFQVKVPAVTKATVWKNIGSVVYENNPNGPDSETPSNEVIITNLNCPDCPKCPDGTVCPPPTRPTDPSTPTNPSNPNRPNNPNNSGGNTTTNTNTGTSTRNPSAGAPATNSSNTNPNSTTTTTTTTKRSTNTGVETGMLGWSLMAAGGLVAATGFWTLDRKKQKKDKQK